MRNKRLVIPDRYYREDRRMKIKTATIASRQLNWIEEANVVERTLSKLNLVVITCFHNAHLPQQKNIT